MDVGAVSQFAEKVRVNILLLQFLVLNKMNVNINNELNFSDVY